MVCKTDVTLLVCAVVMGCDHWTAEMISSLVLVVVVEWNHQGAGTISLTLCHCTTLPGWAVAGEGNCWAAQVLPLFLCRCI